ncbi:hypothetical protein N0V83_009304 [Neocucurbitaria cava]|uniref:Uncharacterized protein n=1 Tax=Neocucurbitaria cava TaxID=798079 RepID=A0A9W8Y198_9PLEO|nr:hypothetical protein N0V83_009304 [Neocucurbitaria cava]
MRGPPSAHTPVPCVTQCAPSKTQQKHDQMTSSATSTPPSSMNPAKHWQKYVSYIISPSSHPPSPLTLTIILSTLPYHLIAARFFYLLTPTNQLLNTPASTLVFVPNATTGVNTVLRNLVFEKGDHILYFDTIYGACEKTVAYITETTPASSVKISYTYPVEDDWLVSAFKQKVKDVEDKGGKFSLLQYANLRVMGMMMLISLVRGCR